MAAIVQRCAVCWLLVVISLLAEEKPVSPWPLDIPVCGGVITLYQPQPERLHGNTLQGRAAASYLANGKDEDERQFGALWFTATLDVDRENDIAKTRTITITKVVTAKGEKAPDEGAAARQAIQDAVVATGIEIDLDRLVSTLEEPGATEGVEYKSEPPHILIRQEPTILVVIDGEPNLRETEGVKRVVNSPAFLAVDGTGAWWLRSELDWLTAAVLTGPWKLSNGSPPSAVMTAAKQAGFSTSLARMNGATAPAVIVVKEPSELVVFTGKPELEPIGDGGLLGATNTDTTVLVEVATNQYYLLLAGRWYRAPALSDDAAWAVVKPDDLPPVFAEIPAKSEWGSIRAHVAGTPEADAAVAQQQIPQTARIPRSNTISVTFDGKPKWVKVSKLEVEYAENSPDAVFRLPGPLYYACRDGVWYEGKDPTAPFIVATSVPDALHRLPPDCPWHNCTYVQVYESTPEYVWCGYTPGYMGWYTWYGCPIYGSGYWHHPWYGPVVVYPRPLTWGVGIHYNPWTGWGVSLGVSRGNWAIGISSGGGGGWWGSGGVNNISIDNSINIDRDNINRGDINRPAQRPAIYDRVPNADRPVLADARDRMRPSAGTQPAGTRQTRDNLAVDRDGTIARPTADGGWQTRENGAWVDRPNPAAKPAQVTAPQPRPAATPQPAPAPSLDRTQQMRSQGEQRVQQRSMPAVRSGGGGGGRRR